MSYCYNSISAKRHGKAKHVMVWENGDFYSDGHAININPNNYRTWNGILALITDTLRPSFGAVRNLIHLESKQQVNSFESLEPNGKYVAIGAEKLKEIKDSYKSLSEKQNVHQPRKYYTESISSQSISIMITTRGRKIILFVMTNGKTQEMPCKVVLTESDIESWDMILEYIARSLDIPEGIQYLHTVFGDPVINPRDIQNGCIYVAVPRNERFVKMNYVRIFRSLLPMREIDLKRVESSLESAPPHIIRDPIVPTNPTIEIAKSKSEGLTTIKHVKNKSIQNSRNSPLNMERVCMSQSSYKKTGLGLYCYNRKTPGQNIIPFVISLLNEVLEQVFRSVAVDTDSDMSELKEYLNNLNIVTDGDISHPNEDQRKAAKNKMQTNSLSIIEEDSSTDNRIYNVSNPDEIEPFINLNKNEVVSQALTSSDHSTDLKKNEVPYPSKTIISIKDKLQGIDEEASKYSSNTREFPYPLALPTKGVNNESSLSPDSLIFIKEIIENSYMTSCPSQTKLMSSDTSEKINDRDQIFSSARGREEDITVSSKIYKSFLSDLIQSKTAIDQSVQHVSRKNGPFMVASILDDKSSIPDCCDKVLDRIERYAKSDHITFSHDIMRQPVPNEPMAAHVKSGSNSRSIQRILEEKNNSAREGQNSQGFNKKSSVLTPNDSKNVIEENDIVSYLSNNKSKSGTLNNSKSNQEMLNQTEVKSEIVTIKKKVSQDYNKESPLHTPNDLRNSKKLTNEANLIPHPSSIKPRPMTKNDSKNLKKNLEKKEVIPYTLKSRSKIVSVKGSKDSQGVSSNGKSKNELVKQNTSICNKSDTNAVQNASTHKNISGNLHKGNRDIKTAKNCHPSYCGLKKRYDVDRPKILQSPKEFIDDIINSSVIFMERALLTPRTFYSSSKGKLKEKYDCGIEKLPPLKEQEDLKDYHFCRSGVELESQIFEIATSKDANDMNTPEIAMSTTKFSSEVAEFSVITSGYLSSEPEILNQPSAPNVPLSSDTPDKINDGDQIFPSARSREEDITVSSKISESLLSDSIQSRTVIDQSVQDVSRQNGSFIVASTLDDKSSIPDCCDKVLDRIERYAKSDHLTFSPDIMKQPVPKEPIAAYVQSGSKLDELNPSKHLNEKSSSSRVPIKEKTTSNLTISQKPSSPFHLGLPFQQNPAFFLTNKTENYTLEPSNDKNYISKSQSVNNTVPSYHSHTHLPTRPQTSDLEEQSMPQAPATRSILVYSKEYISDRNDANNCQLCCHSPKNIIKEYRSRILEVPEIREFYRDSSEDWKDEQLESETDYVLKVRSNIDKEAADIRQYPSPSLNVRVEGDSYNEVTEE